jgi:hypothetical protein
MFQIACQDFLNSMLEGSYPSEVKAVSQIPSAVLTSLDIKNMVTRYHNFRLLIK